MHKSLVILINGNLGSGKTTVLTELLAQPRLMNAAVIENEIAPKSFDSDMLSLSNDEEREVMTLAGECICCTDPRQLVTILNSLRSKDQGRPIIIESTGAAQAAKLLTRLLSEPQFEDEYEIASSIYVIDAFNFNRGTYDQDDASLAQIVLVTKSDLEPIRRPLGAYMDKQCVDFRALSETILSADSASIQTALYRTLSSIELRVDHAPATLVLAPATVRTLDSQEIQTEMVKHGVLRIKGFIEYASQSYVIDGTQDSLRIAKERPKHQTYLVSIGGQKNQLEEFISWIST